MDQCALQQNLLSGRNGDGPDAALLARAIVSAGCAMHITDVDDRIVWANEAYARLSGYDFDDLIGASPDMFRADASDRAAGRLRLAVARNGEAWRTESANRRQDGTMYFTDEVVTPVRDAAGGITHFISILHDVTESRAVQRYQRARANQDALTGLASRAHLLELFDQHLVEARRTQRMMAILFIDLDGFKPINDAHGHLVGDAVLKAVGARLQSVIRCSDTVARFGGDEFVILLPAIVRRRVARHLALKVLELAAQPFAMGSERYRLGASVGIAFFPDHGDARDALLCSADQAMYRAKRQGGGRAFEAGATGAPARVPDPGPAPAPVAQLVRHS